MHWLLTGVIFEVNTLERMGTIFGYMPDYLIFMYLLIVSGTYMCQTGIVFQE